MTSDKTVPRLWRLRTSSWVGTSIGAQHVYATICGGYDQREWKIERKLGSTEITRINKERREMGFGPLEYLHPGDYFDGFETTEDAVAASAVAWEQMKSTGDSLVHYTSDSAFVREDGTLIAGPDGLIFFSPSKMSGYIPTRSIFVSKQSDGWRIDRVEND